MHNQGISYICTHASLCNTGKFSYRHLSTSRRFDGYVHAKYEVKNGVAVVKLDSPNSKVNTLNVETMTEVKEIMDMINKDANVHASVLMSGTLKENFMLYFCSNQI
jgi:enoyl-CoA hydratase/long-chain 3-hydroxyacyl-CoA dehydrogenase